MNWYRRYLKFAALSDMLQQLGVSEDIINFVESLPNDQKQFYVNTLRQNPQMSLEELQSSVQMPQEQQVDPYFDFEKQKAQNFPEQAQKWILTTFKRLRNSDLNFDRTWGSFSQYPEYFNFEDKLREWQDSNALTDFLNANPNYNLKDKDPQQVKQDVQEWHDAMAERGKGKYYTENNIIYGPEWENEEFNGWTIQEITSSNDLEVEGYEMQNCIGGDDYCEAVKNGKIRIFSLRDPQNKPHITIETDPQIYHVYQIEGADASTKPKKEYRQMIKEWMQSRDQSAAHYDQTDADTNSVDDILNFIDEIRYGVEDDMGIQQDFDNFVSYNKHTQEHEIDWADVIEELLTEAMNEKRNSKDQNYDGDITNAPDTLVEAAANYGYKSLYELLWHAGDKLSEWEPEVHDKIDFVYEPPPEPQNYETDDEYKEAYEQWEREKEDYEQEYTEEVLSSWLPTAFLKDIWNEYDGLVGSGKVPNFKELEKHVKENTQDDIWQTLYGTS